MVSCGLCTDTATLRGSAGASSTLVQATRAHYPRILGMGVHIAPIGQTGCRVLDGFLRGLVDRGYARSTWEELDVRMLDSQTALASGITVRYRSDDTVLERVAVTYALRDSAEGWKIFMSATHAPGSVLRFR